MILQNDLIVTSLVIEAEIVTEQRLCWYLLGLKTEEVDLRVVLDLQFLVVRHPRVLK